MDHQEHLSFVQLIRSAAPWRNVRGPLDAEPCNFARVLIWEAAPNPNPPLTARSPLFTVRCPAEMGWLAMPSFYDYRQDIP